jgi:lipid-A-disaccharide synthase
MLSCGEASGDLYAGALTAELRSREAAIEVFGFGGHRFAAAGGDLVGDFEGLTVTGLTEALRVLPRSYAMLRRLVRAARERRPDVFVAIDFPDFNFRLAGALRRLGIPVVYYVSPQLWAWRSGRMATMKQLADKVLVIFPFEQAIYERAGVPVEFVGHPLVDLAKVMQPRAAFLRDRGLVPEAPTVALLPGSRPNEIHRIAPTMLAALPLIRARVPDAQFVVACAPTLAEVEFAPFAAAGATLVYDRADDVLASSDVVITASGTATVQAAVHERPMVVVYRLSPMTYRLGRRFVTVEMYAMPNLVAGRRVVPELIQEGFTAQAAADETVAFLTDREKHARTREALRHVREALGSPGASARAAEAVLEVAHRRTRNGSKRA